jgi:aspartyl-tRNA synthetase
MKRILSIETLQHIDQEVLLQGWVDTIRDHGKLVFIELRDRSGKVQVVGDSKMGKLSAEDVVEITGTVSKRPEQMINKDLPTGTIEVKALSFKLLNECKELPFPIDTDGTQLDEELKLKYRYLDLRRQRLQKAIRLRSKLIEEYRKSLFAEDFVEIETPMLTKSTKEGARDFVVPSRFQPGKFYALPQSPQQYKQLLMTAGFERYFQIARCIRDEDLRADRGFEFTQLDLEMSFVKREDVMEMVENATKAAVLAVGGKLKDQQFPVFTYQEAIKKYGADKFDLRSEEEKKQGVLAFAWVIDFPFFKKVNKEDIAEVRDGKSGWTFTHNPFSIPKDEFITDHLEGKNIENILTTQYDLVCNGYEAGGGSIRAHDPKILAKTFEIMGYGEKEIEESVGHMLEAFKLGTPPHGGIALGLDRLVMILSQQNSIKDGIAFPMTSTGRTAVMDAPSPIADEQMKELGIQLRSMKQNAGAKSVYEEICSYLDSEKVEYKTFEHKPVFTSEEAAQVRGTSIESGAKALVCMADGKPIMVVVSAASKLDLKAFKQATGFKDVALVDKDTLLKVTGLQPGSVPPFGSLFGISYIC